MRDSTTGVAVLLVEDDAHISGIVADHLGHAGYACTQAFSGTEARLVLEAADARGERFDVVVCDLMLPGLPGEDIVLLVRAADAHTPIVVTSARTSATDKVDLLKLGADDYLAKPFDLDELLARIEVQLRHRGRAFAVAGGDDVLRVGKWTLDRAARWPHEPGEPVLLAACAPADASGLCRIPLRPEWENAEKTILAYDEEAMRWRATSCARARR